MNLTETALSQWGESEEPGAAVNPAIGRYLANAGLPANDEIAWCSAFLYWCAVTAGVEHPPGTKAAAAKSWLDCGRSIVLPATGDVVILRREGAPDWAGHVGIYLRTAGDKVWVLGGNQGNAVSIAAFRASSVIGYRRLRPMPP